MTCGGRLVWGGGMLNYSRTGLLLHLITSEQCLFTKFLQSDNVRINLIRLLIWTSGETT